MRTTIDRAGRVVIPKSIRDQLGLRGGTELEIREQDGRVDIAVVGPTAYVDRSGPRPILRVRGDVPLLTDENVRQVLNQVRGERSANR